MILGSSKKETHMAVTQLTQTNLEDTINDNDIVVIDFWAPWCGPCQTFKPIFEQAAEKHDDAVFASCNTEEQSELAAMFQIQSIPTLVVFREGIGIFGQPGMLPAEALDELMDKVRGLDMGEVRAEAEKQQETATADA
jgi:thioredoxin 1